MKSNKNTVPRLPRELPKSDDITSQDLQAQRDYAQKLKQSGFDFNLVVADAFIRGIRDLGYKSTATALDELIDNPLQASAANVHVLLGFGNSEKKPEKIAVIDDGHGMDPLMIRAAVIWGGTHRENDRTGFGRYGYGLPSAAVSQGRQFTVYSVVEGGQLHAVTIDIDDIGAGKYSDKDGRVTVPEAGPAELPSWVTEYMKQHLKNGQLTHGTVVTMEKLDRLSWKTTDALLRHLKEHFGVTYRNFLREVNLFVQGDAVDPVDPLFLTPGTRYYDLDEDRAQSLPPLEIKVKDGDSKRVLGTVKVRFSLMPPTFQKSKTGTGWNPRLHIMKEHNGIIVLRKGRQIDVITKCPWLTFVNYDRNWKVELDYPPTLDEEFSITTSKQQIGLSDRMWELLREAGVWRAIEQFRSEVKEAFAKLRTERKENEKLASEQVMEKVEKFKTRRSAEDPIEQSRKSIEELKKVARTKAQLSGLPVEKVEEQLIEDTKSRPYKVETESLPGAPFFRVAQIGGQKVLYLNASHRFYTDVYAGPDSGPRLRRSLEVLLFVIGECELDSTQDRKRFYETERAEWSKVLNIALDMLNEIDSIEDDLSARDAISEDAQQDTTPAVQ